MKRVDGDSSKRKEEEGEEREERTFREQDLKLVYSSVPRGLHSQAEVSSRVSIQAEVRERQGEKREGRRRGNRQLELNSPSLHTLLFSRCRARFLPSGDDIQAEEGSTSCLQPRRRCKKNLGDCTHASLARNPGLPLHQVQTSIGSFHRTSKESL